MAALTSPASPIATSTSRRCAAQQAAGAARRCAAGRAGRQRRVQVDDVRHHRRAEDAGGQQQALGAGEARARGRRRAARPRPATRSSVSTNPTTITAKQPRDRPLERPVPAFLQRQQPERDHARHQRRRSAAAARRAGSARPRRRSTSARSVAIATISACTHSPSDRAREGVAADLGQVAAGRQARASPTATGSASPSRFAATITHSSR